ncbi:MAG: peptidylprolyl isomerase [Deltaproteobacteria bacterium]|nr:peptidylprolyl isomerase [Deltaproteobacteria bacterium]MBW2343701.1 peptidylprolyl isomerase [Deltaproteobacteria bacterium]
MRGLKIFYALLFLTAPAFFWYPSPARAETSNRVVAIVNDEVITLYELNGRMKELTGLEPAEMRLRDEKQYLEARREILNSLIEEKLTLGKIRQLGVKVTPKQVDSAIERIKRNNGLTQEDMIAGLKKRGITYDSYREKIKIQLERMELINFEVKSKIIIREEDITEYYNKHRDEFVVKGKVHLAIIVLKQEGMSNQDGSGSLSRQAADILAKLKGGEDFGELARKFSKGPGAEDGGDVGFFNVSQLDPKLGEIIKQMSPGDISEPILRPSGIQIVKLIDNQEERLKPIEEVKNAIYQIFYQKEVNKRYSAWIKELRDKAYTKIIF